MYDDSNTFDVTTQDEISQGWGKHRVALAAWAMKYMVNRTDCCGAHSSLEDRGKDRGDGRKVPKNWTEHRELTRTRLELHFAGAGSEHVIGLHSTKPGDLCKWVSLDIDSHSDEDAQATADRNRAFAMDRYAKLARLGLRPLLWDSNGKGGFHVDVIFSQPIPSLHAFRFGLWLVADWKEYEFAQQPESFPKQPSLTGLKQGCGNWLRLIGRHHTRAIWATVYDSESGEWLSGEAAARAVIDHQPVSPDCIPVDALAESETERKRRLDRSVPRDCSSIPDGSKLKRATAYAAAVPPAVSGQGGSNHTFALACKLVSFGIAKQDAFDILADWNDACDPPWADHELWHKIDDAFDKNPPPIEDRPNPKQRGIHNAPKHSRSIETCGDEWDDIIPLSSCDVATCPVDCIPHCIRNYLEWVAYFTQTPVDIAVGQWLAAVAIAVQRKFVVEPIPGWQEPLSLYIVSVMEPGNRKSAVAKMVGSPIRAYEKHQREVNAPALRRARADNELKTKQRTKLVDEIAKGASDRDAKRHELDALDAELANAPSLEELTLLVDDITPEQIATLMAKNGGRLGILTAEGDLFDILAGRYSKQANIGTVLKGHCGDEIRVNRGNRPSELIPNPALTMGLAVQLDVLQGLLDKKEFRGRGLLARILFQLPTSPVGYREIDTQPCDGMIEQAYQSAMSHVLKLHADENDDGYVAQSLTLSPEAFSLFREYRIRIEKSFREFGDLEKLKDWGSKLPGGVARIAGLLHLIEHAESYNLPLTISGDSMQNAIRLGDYFSDHAQAAFQAMGEDENKELAESVVAAIKRHSFQSFNRRQLHQILRRQVEKPDDLDIPLDLLCAHGFIRERETERDCSKRGRSPSRAYETNPNVFETIA